MRTIVMIAAVMAAACSGGDAAPKPDAQVTTPDAPLASIDATPAPGPIDARPPDARSGFADGPTGAAACTYPVNASCNTNRTDYRCTEADFGGGWVRQDVTNLDCPNGSGNTAPCGNPTQPYVVSVIRLCRAGGAGQTAPCPVGTQPMTGPNGCAVCEITNLSCL